MPRFVTVKTCCFCDNSLYLKIRDKNLESIYFFFYSFNTQFLLLFYSFFLIYFGETCLNGYKISENKKKRALNEQKKNRDKFLQSFHLRVYLKLTITLEQYQKQKRCL